MIDKMIVNMRKVLSKNYGNITKSCEEFGITRKDFYLYMKDERFSSMVKEIEDEVFKMVEEKLFNFVNKGCVKSIEYIRKIKCNKREEKINMILK